MTEKWRYKKGLISGSALNDLNILIGSTYEQGFIRFGQFFKVYTRAAPEFRRLPSDILNLYTKNEKGEMVPYSAFMSLEKTQGLTKSLATMFTHHRPSMLFLIMATQLGMPLQQ